MAVDSLFQVNNISTESVLDEKEFAMISNVIVFALLPRENTQRNTTEYIDVYREILQRYATNELCERILDKLLRDINKSIGKHLNKKQVPYVLGRLTFSTFFLNAALSLGK